MAQGIRWATIECALCSVPLLVPITTLRRVADGQTFVTCVPCAIRYELELHSITYHELPGDFVVPKDVPPAA